MFAEGEEINVLHNDHLVVFLLKEGICQHLVGILIVAAGEYLHRLGYAHRSLDKSFALCVFTQELQYFLIVSCEFIPIPREILFLDSYLIYF